MMVGFPLWHLFDKLRRAHRFPLGPADYVALRAAMRAGFGWESHLALRRLCCSLWAKSRAEEEIVTALFDQTEMGDWNLASRIEALSSTTEGSGDVSTSDQNADLRSGDEAEEGRNAAERRDTVLVSKGALPEIDLSSARLPPRPLVLIPQLPLSYRDMAQAWRRLRRPVREGVPVELDITATIARWSTQGTASSVVLMPRRRNTARLLLLVDRRGSMVPFHLFVDEAIAAIKNAGRLQRVAQYYFHDVPIEGADEAVLTTLTGALFPTLDTVLPAIPPLIDGFLYTDADLNHSAKARDALEDSRGACVVFFSDAGAARRNYDALRLLDTVAFLKALKAYADRVLWLNPVPQNRWPGSTAAQIARHVHMFPLTRRGIYDAVNVFRGQVYPLERPL